jgi:hypothetical protein
MTDLDTLIGERCRIGIISLDDLGDYHRKFFAITGFIKGKSRISDNEINRSFVRGFTPDLWDKVKARLQLKSPDHYPDDPWDVKDVYEAAKFVLHGSLSFRSTTSSSPTSSSDTTSASDIKREPDVGIKKEELFTMFEQFTQSIVKALGTKPSGSDSGNKPRRCFYDGGEHLGNSCEKLKDHLAKGLCKRNAEGKICLPNDSLVHRNLPGNNMAERVEKWNQDNPRTSSAMIFAVSSTSLDGDTAPTNTYALEETARKLAELEQEMKEMYELRRRQVMDSVEIPRRNLRSNANQPSKPTPPAQSDKPPTSQQKKKTPTPATVESDKSKTPTPTSSKSADSHPLPPTQQSIEKPIHPFAKASENSYVPPHERNFAAKPTKDKDVAYRTTAPIQSPAIVDSVYNKTMKNQSVTLSPEEIMSIAPNVRAKVKEAITPKRVPQKTPQPTGITTNIIEESALPYGDEEVEVLVSDAVDKELLAGNNSDPPPGSLIIPDYMEAYLQSLSAEEVDNQVVVAKDSHALRSVSIKVNFSANIEGVVDPGCQIVAMSEAVCIYLKLSYDPTVYLTMESANGSLDRSLGLARNVPCKIGSITLYFQIHIIRNPAYDILLGRPFDVLTESVIHNYADENQTITIHDPNSKNVATVPTFPRRRPRFKLPPPPKKTVPKATVEDEEEEQRDF